jgi:hypothetical protein
MPQLAPALFGVKIAGLGKSNASFPTKASVPSPISRTWRPRSSTARAAKTGLRGPKMPATAPARYVAPSITHASISCVPAAVKTLPRQERWRAASLSLIEEGLATRLDSFAALLYKRPSPGRPGSSVGRATD